MNYVKGIKLIKMPDSSNYLSDLAAVQCLSKMDRLKFDKPVTFFVGENGTGKSTLLQAIAVSMGLNSDGGKRNYNSMKYNNHTGLDRYVKVYSYDSPKASYYLRAENFYQSIKDLEEYESYTGKSFHEQSFGESFLTLAEYRFEENGLYILDEPEAALSPQRLLALLKIINGLVKEGSQFIISTHSSILTAYPNADIFEFKEASINKVDYKETGSYQLIKEIMDNPVDKMKEILGE